MSASSKVNFDTVSIAPKTPTRDNLNRADLESSSAHSFPGPAYKRPGPSASARDVHRMFWEHDRARVWGQAETAGPRWEPALGRAWGGRHRWMRRAKKGVIRPSVVVLVVFSQPSSQPQGNANQYIQSILLYRSSILERAHLALVLSWFSALLVWKMCCNF